ncbi:hypothetical protein [Halogranum rubrum]|uniref:hypothetical protein n=1 Tax=Halogranum rubrum TaxID=553466 RepID=UPI000677961A|nr:hypothetical protein [Halogranum salarium]
MKSREFERLIDDEEIEGWKIKEDGDERVLMFKPNYGTLGGHTLVALLTVWWTFGIGNGLYAAYKYVKSPQKVVREEQIEVEKEQPTIVNNNSLQ